MNHLSSENEKEQWKTEIIHGGTKSISLTLNSLSLILSFVFLNCRHLQLHADHHLPIWPLLLLSPQPKGIQWAVSVPSTNSLPFGVICLICDILLPPAAYFHKLINCLPTPSVTPLFALFWNSVEVLSFPFMLWVYSLKSFRTELACSNSPRQTMN